MKIIMRRVATPTCGLVRNDITILGLFWHNEIPGVVHHTGGIFYVFRMNFSWHRGQVMEIFPFPLGTRTSWRHLGQSK